MTTSEAEDKEQKQPLKRAGKRNLESEFQTLKDLFSWIDPNMRMKVIKAYQNSEPHNAKLYDFLEDLAKIFLVNGDIALEEKIKQATIEADAEAEAAIKSEAAQAEPVATRETKTGLYFIDK